MQRKFSIITPVYNGEKYILKCMQSIKDQTYKNIEFVIVNDGSTDSTHQIITQFAKDNPDMDIKILKIENGGLANARNEGIKIATGDFMCNLDADDYLDNNIFEELNNVTVDYDICQYGWKDIDEDTYLPISTYDETSFHFIKEPIDGITAALMKITKYMWICQGNAVYRLSMIKDNNICNVKGLNQGEDFYFITRALLHAKKVCSVPINAFNCLMRKSSMMHSSFNKSFLQLYEIYRLLLKDVRSYTFLGEKRDEIIGRVASAYYLTRITIAKKIIDSYPLSKIGTILSEIKKNTPLLDIKYGDIVSYIPSDKKTEINIYRFSRFLYVLFAKLYRKFKK